MKALPGGESGFNGQQPPLAEAGGGIPIAGILGAAAVGRKLDSTVPEQPPHFPRITSGTVDIDYLLATGLVRRSGDWSVSV